MGQVVPLIIPSIGISNTFYMFGAIFLVVLLIVAQKLSNPPADWAVASPKKAARPSVSTPVDIKGAVKMPQFYLLWLVLFINVTAGIALPQQPFAYGSRASRIKRHSRRNDGSRGFSL